MPGGRMRSVDETQDAAGQVRCATSGCSRAAPAYECIFDLVQAAFGAEDGDVTVIASRRSTRHGWRCGRGNEKCAEGQQQGPTQGPTKKKTG